MSRPRRLEGFSYVGKHQYFLTFCCRDRLTVFKDHRIAAQTLAQFRRTASLEQFSILAYCLMPDHAHLLAEGLCDSSDFRRFAKMARQRAGALYARTRHLPLWQPGYFERVVREEDDARAMAGYIVNNPVRARLVDSPVDYPFVGSDVWSLEDLLESIV